MFKQKENIKILVSDTAPLYPPLWGGPKRIWYLFSNLSQDLFSITYVGVNSVLKRNKKFNFDKIRDNFKEICCTFPPHYYAWHLIEKFFFKEHSIDLFAYLLMHTSWQFKYIINSQNADVLVCSHPWSSLSMPKNNRQIFIYDAHNCEYLLMSQILEGHLLKRLILKEVKKVEARACKKSDLILVCSEKEKKDFITIYRVDAEKIIIIPNGANGRADKMTGSKESSRQELLIGPQDKVVIFIGTYYKPNIDAAKYIIETIAPALKEFEFLIVGTVAYAFTAEQIPSNVNFLGRVSEKQLAMALNASNIAINPMFTGSGINIKMLDYMSYGLPVVTSECGARGIETSSKQPMTISDIDKFADNIKMLMDNSVLYKQMSEDGKDLIAERYNWQTISNKLQKIILERLE